LARRDPYLSPEAIAATLQALPRCTLATTYNLPADLWDPAVTAASHTFLEMARQGGEPVLTLLRSEDIEGCYGIAALSLGSERVVLATKG
jgi:hypothetical protein